MKGLLKKNYSISGWRVNPATELTFGRRCDIDEILKKCGGNLNLPKEIDRMSVNRMKLVNGSAAKEDIRTSLGGIPACEIERKLNIKGPWHLALTKFTDYPPAKTVDEARFQGEIAFHVDVEKRKYPCPVCGRMCGVKEYEKRTYFHTPMLECKTAIIARVPKIHCPEHGYLQLRVPWARKGMSYTLFFERNVLRELQSERSILSVAKGFDTTESIIGTLIKHRVSLTMERMDLSHVHTIWVDETSWKVGHWYVTVVYDQLWNLIFVCEGRDSKTMKLFSEWLAAHNGDPTKIENVSCDMGLAYPKGVRENFPNAVITYDKFHVIKLMVEAFREVLERQERQDKAIKWFRTMAFQSNSISEDDEKKLDSLVEDYPEAGRNYRLLLVITHIYEYQIKELAEYYFDVWFRAVMKYGAPEMKRAAASLNERKEDIFRWYDSRINNGVVEGKNAQIKLLVRRARGFTNVEHLIAMLYLLLSNQPLFYDEQELECLNVEPSGSEASS